MRLLTRIRIVILATLLIISPAQLIQAAPPEPNISSTPPLVPEQSLPVSPDEQADSTYLQTTATILASLPPLKAVLVVGPIDGDYGTWTLREKANMDLVATELQANGVTVYKFYTPNNNWEQIKSAAQGAHFFFYRGHGVYWGDPNYPYTVGSLALKDGIIAPSVLREDLHLAANAVVMFYGCYTAGSSSADTISLRSAEAQRRVVMYAQPFIENGAGAYFANWFGDAFQKFVRSLFQGATLGQAYESYFDFNATTVERYIHPSNPQLSLWLDKDEWYDPKPQYNNAFIGNPAATLADLFTTPISIAPQVISYLTEPISSPQILELQVHSTLSDLSWTTSISPGVSWVTAPTQGSSADPIQVTITPPAILGVYQATINIMITSSITDPAGFSIPVYVLVTEEIHKVFLPATSRGR